MRDQVTTNDFKWKEQLKFTQSEEEILVSQFDGKLVYGCEYYPPGRLTVPTGTSTRFRYECFQSCVGNKMLLVQGEEGQGKGHLIRDSACFFGQFQKEVICHSRLSAYYIGKFVQGAIAAGAWLTFYEFETLSYSACAELLHLVSRANLQEHRPQPFLFTLASHHQQV